MSKRGRSDLGAPPPQPKYAGTAVLERLDAALLDLRRFTQVPRDRTATYGVDEDRTVGMSTVLVVHALASTSGRCDIGAVAAVLHVAHSTASRLVDRAAAAGMLTRGRDTDDPRRTALTLTEAGHRLNAEAIGFRTRHLQSVLSHWCAEDIDTFTTLLERFATDSSHHNRERNR